MPRHLPPYLPYGREGFLDKYIFDVNRFMTMRRFSIIF
jgi:hypothetical protein